MDGIGKEFVEIQRDQCELIQSQASDRGRIREGNEK